MQTSFYIHRSSYIRQSLRALSARRARLALPFTLAFLSACSSSPAPSEQVGTATERIISGTDSDASQDAVVMILYVDPSSDNVGTCTGTLLAPNLVLTARHCVADTDEGAICDSAGNPIEGGAVKEDYPPEKLFVFTGVHAPDSNAGPLTPDGQGKQIFTDGSTNICNRDIALIQLTAPIPNAKIAPIRLDSPVLKGEVFTAVGWGYTETTTSPPVRQQRTGITIELVGPSSAIPNEQIGPNEFLVGESICSGDSGGPALAKTSAVLGVVSRGGNGMKPDPTNPAAGCIGDATRNIYTKVQPFKPLIEQAAASAGGTLWLEGLAKPGSLPVDAPCLDSTECESNICADDPSQPGTKTCAQVCGDGPDDGGAKTYGGGMLCPEGQQCVTDNNQEICRVLVKGTSPVESTSPNAGSNSSVNLEPAESGSTSTSGSSGCSTVPGSTSTPSGLGILGFTMLGLVMARSRSSSRSRRG